MTEALMLAVGLALGAGGCWALMRAEAAYLRRELTVAQDRLLHAWQDGAKIPPRPLPPTPPPAPLPKQLQEAIDEWESPESRLAMEAKIRGYYDRGWKPLDILRQLENEHP